MICGMTTTARRPRRYDHRLREAGPADRGCDDRDGRWRPALDGQRVVTPAAQPVVSLDVTNLTEHAKSTLSVLKRDQSVLDETFHGPRLPASAGLAVYLKPANLGPCHVAMPPPSVAQVIAA